MTRHVDQRYDPDLWPLRDDAAALAAAQAVLCSCGHPRGAHVAATGALGSFGGSACDLCWTCASFTPVEAAA